MSDPKGPAVDLTLLVCTFNRSADLGEMLETALAQETDDAFTYEVLVVDNNSTDDTRQVVERYISAGHTNLRYIFEPRQGKSIALNTGLAALRGRLYTIADDDFILPADWLKHIVAAFRAHPDAAFVSGKVLPLWQDKVPAWLTREHWSPVAVADYGDEEFYADEARPICLLACSFRVDAVERAGGYQQGLSVSENQIGGVEDVEILQRLWKSGRRGLYLPHISFHHKVPAARMTKAYHRRWHRGHGRFYARLRDAEFERSSARLFDVPAHVYKAMAASAARWVMTTVLRRGSGEAFMHEARLWFYIGFVDERLAVSNRSG